MSLPNYLARIKSSGIYRFTWDKSVVPTSEAYTLRLVVGYSEKGPFNTPVYIDNPSAFTNIYGRASKRLERKGVFFHRLALQALANGPIIALNLKPFKEESVNTINFSADASAENVLKPIKDIYDTSRFWKLDPDIIPHKINPEDTGEYIYLAATDAINSSCSYFMRKWKGASPAYDLTIREWYANQPDLEIPEYLNDDAILDTMLSDYFAEIYVFKGQFTEALCKESESGASGPLARYFNQPAKATKPEAAKPSPTAPVGPDAKSAPVKAKTVSEPAAFKIELKSDYKNIFGETADALEALSDDPNSNFIGVYRGCLFPYFKNANGYYESLDVDFNRDIDSHKMIMKLDEAALDRFADGAEIIKKLVPAKDWQYATTPNYMPGYTYTTITKDSTADEIQEASYGVLADPDCGVREALSNNVDIKYHYIIDTFKGLPSEAGVKCKQYLSSLAKLKDNALAIINFPSIKDLTLANPKIIKSNGRLDGEVLKTTFGMPTDGMGASYCAFYTPVVLSDGTLKTTIPSAALVINNFMEKYKTRQPYYIVAGPNYGRLDWPGLIGPDHNYSRNDLDILEPYGVNVNVYVPRKGTFINSNQTAKQIPVSALSKVHVRELIIYLQDEIEKMLQNYQWELNTQTLRNTIKAKADVILENVKNNGGVYEYLNVCDETNNTPEVIDNEMIILDTAIEPARGAGKMVQQITIHKTGAMSSMTK